MSYKSHESAQKDGLFTYEEATGYGYGYAAALLDCMRWMKDHPGADPAQLPAALGVEKDPETETIF